MFTLVSILSNQWIGKYIKKKSLVIKYNFFRTFAMIKPDAYQNIGKIIDLVEKDGFRIAQLKMTHFTRENAEQFYSEHRAFNISAIIVFLI